MLTHDEVARCSPVVQYSPEMQAVWDQSSSVNSVVFFYLSVVFLCGFCLFLYLHCPRQSYDNATVEEL